jgi:hypothetical protein
MVNEGARDTIRLYSSPFRRDNPENRITVVKTWTKIFFIMTVAE